jgi:hypothetical protein
VGENMAQLFMIFFGMGAQWKASTNRLRAYPTSFAAKEALYRLSTKRSRSTLAISRIEPV